MQRDFLLSLAVEGMYRPVWSWKILAELEFHEQAKLERRGCSSENAKDRAAWLIGQMRGAFEDAEVEGWERLEGSYGLPDPNDEHVVAAAFVARAGAIITFNSGDFPPGKLPHGLEAVLPAAFAASTVALNPLVGLRAVEAMASRSGKKGPDLGVREVLDLLEDRYGLTDAADTLRSAL